MGIAFLSDDWFEHAKAARADQGDIDVPEELKSLVINLTIDTGAESPVTASIREGFLEKGHDDSASSTMILTEKLAYKIFLQNDTTAGMMGFMTGDLKVEGDMGQILTLQSVKPTDSLKAFQAKLKEQTDF